MKDTSADLGLDMGRQPGSSDFDLILSTPSYGHQIILPPRDNEGFTSLLIMKMKGLGLDNYFLSPGEQEAELS